MTMNKGMTDMTDMTDPNTNDIFIISRDDDCFTINVKVDSIDDACELIRDWMTRTDFCNITIERHRG